jgi:hypothetical protein
MGRPAYSDLREREGMGHSDLLTIAPPTEEVLTPTHLGGTMRTLLLIVAAALLAAPAGAYGATAPAAG